MVYFMRTTSLDLLVNQDPGEIVQISQIRMKRNCCWIKKDMFSVTNGI